VLRRDPGVPDLTVHGAAHLGCPLGCLDVTRITGITVTKLLDTIAHGIVGAEFEASTTLRACGGHVLVKGWRGPVRVALGTGALGMGSQGDFAVTSEQGWVGVPGLSDLCEPRSFLLCLLIVFLL